MTTATTATRGGGKELAYSLALLVSMAVYVITTLIACVVQICAEHIRA